jgi:hypothetical protein
MWGVSPRVLINSDLVFAGRLLTVINSSRNTVAYYVLPEESDIVFGTQE